MLPGGEFAALATGANGDGCGILRPEEGSADDASVESGFVECWGDHVSGENGPPDEMFTSIAVGFEYACGVRTDGTVACWGSNPSGKASLTRRPVCRHQPRRLPQLRPAKRWRESNAGAGTMSARPRPQTAPSPPSARTRTALVPCPRTARTCAGAK